MTFDRKRYLELIEARIKLSIESFHLGDQTNKLSFNLSFIYQRKSTGIAFYGYTSLRYLYICRGCYLIKKHCKTMIFRY